MMNASNVMNLKMCMVGLYEYSTFAIQVKANQNGQKPLRSLQSTETGHVQTQLLHFLLWDIV